MEMNEIDALQNQFHDELHETNKSIINVSKDLDGLSSRFEAVEASNKEVNSNLNEIANKVDNIISKIKDLDTKAEKAVEVQVRNTKSATRSVELSQLTSIYDDIHEVALAVDNLDGDLEPRVEQLEIHVNDLYKKYADLLQEDVEIRSDMIDMDLEHHAELHRLALAIDNMDSSVDFMWNDASIFKAYTYSEINKLYVEDSSLEQGLIDMDIEHHYELHLLAMKIDELNGKIEKIYNYYIHYEETINRIDASLNDLSANLTIVTNKVDSLPPLIVLTKEEYDDLDYPDYNTFYFTYEDED